MKKLLILLAFTSCTGGRVMEKPFIIINKYIDFTRKDNCKYYYEDKHGNVETFTEYNNKYNVGDTIR